MRVPPRRRVAGRDGRAADRGRQPRRGPGTAVDRRRRCWTKGRPALSAGGTNSPGGPGSPSTSTACVPGSPTSRWATPRTRRSDPGANSLLRWPATPPQPKRSTRSWRRFTRPTTTGRGSSSATALRCSSSTSPARTTGWRSPCPRDPRAREPRARRDLAQGRSGAGALDVTPAPTATRWWTPFVASWPTTGTPRARSGRTRPTASTSRRSGHGRRASCGSRPGTRAPRLWVADGPPCTTAYEDVSGLWDVPSDLALRLSRGRAACNAGGAAGRRRRRGACGDPPRSR